MNKTLLTIMAIAGLLILGSALVLAQTTTNPTATPTTTAPHLTQQQRQDLKTQLTTMEQKAISENWALSQLFQERDKILQSFNLPAIGNQFGTMTPFHGMGMGFGHHKDWKQKTTNEPAETNDSAEND